MSSVYVSSRADRSETVNFQWCFDFAHQVSHDVVWALGIAFVGKEVNRDLVYLVEVHFRRVSYSANPCCRVD